MDSDIKIMKFLLENKEKSFTIRQISQETKINYRIAYEKISLLEKEKLISVDKLGKSNICKLTYNFNSKVYLAELERRESLFLNKEFNDAPTFNPL